MPLAVSAVVRTEAHPCLLSDVTRSVRAGGDAPVRSLRPPHQRFCVHGILIAAGNRSRTDSNQLWRSDILAALSA